MSKLMEYVGIVQRTMVSAAQRASEKALRAFGRRGRAALLRFARKPVAEIIAEADATMALIGHLNDEGQSWISAADIAAGRSGPFDAADLQAWMAIAKIAGLRAVPAKEILRLTEDEFSFLSGQMELSDKHMKAVRERFQALAEHYGVTPGEVATKQGIDAEALDERLFAAMDSVPEGYMVRTARCGSARLKALAGAGVAGPVVPEVKFNSQLEAGPGWTRIGNRRKLEALDDRIFNAYLSHTLGGDVVYVARPWLAPATMVPCLDPHREQTPIKGPGWWPIELRVFVTGGRVTGVSSYYPWLAVEPTPKTARLMLEARRLTEKLIETCEQRQLFPRSMENEKARYALEIAEAIDLAWRDFCILLDKQGRDSVSFTADFLYADLGNGESGLMLLECGPPAGAQGGAHIVGFCGAYGPPFQHSAHACKGVAFRQMDHIDLLNPRSWVPGDTEGRILTWQATEELAASDISTTKSEDGCAIVVAA